MSLAVSAAEKIRRIAEVWESGDLASAVREAVDIADQIEKSKASPVLVLEARETYANDDLEIDDDALTSRADESNGTWVNAWVWMCDPDDDDEDKLVQPTE